MRPSFSGEGTRVVVAFVAEAADGITAFGDEFLLRGRFPIIPIVLFVCVENSFRSVMAEAFFNAAPPLSWRAMSAGVDAAGKALNLRVIPLMAEVGLDVSRKRPQQVTPDMIRAAARVVTFHCIDRCPPGALGKSEDWSIPGATGKTEAQLRAIRDEVKRHVVDLIERLPKSRREAGGFRWSSQ